MEPAIEISGLTHTFGRQQVLIDVNLEVDRGRIFGLLGPNGAGKTTMVRILTTLLRHTSGLVRVGGLDLRTDARSVRRFIGATQQRSSLDPLMTGWELLHLHAVLHGLSSKSATIHGEALFERLGIAQFAHRRIGTYSGGMQRRVDLAVSFLHEPQVMFLDEPTAALDPNSRLAMWREIERIKDAHGTTVLLTTHHLEEAERLADSLVILDQGRIVRSGTPEALKQAMHAPILHLVVQSDRVPEAKGTLATFGPSRPSHPGGLAVALPGGPSHVAPVIRALDGLGIAIEGLELRQPTLDDVFVDATGEPYGSTPAANESWPPSSPAAVTWRGSPT